MRRSTNHAPGPTEPNVAGSSPAGRTRRCLGVSNAPAVFLHASSGRSVRVPGNPAELFHNQSARMGYCTSRRTVLQ
jgi:hypothetical protein